MKSSLKKLLLSVFVLMISLSANAQLPGDPPGDEDPPEASINKYVILFTLLLISFAFMFFRKLNKKAIK